MYRRALIFFTTNSLYSSAFPQVATCNWVDECFSKGADNQTTGESTAQLPPLPFEPFRGQEELSGGLLPPTPPARVHPALNGGNPWASDLVNKATGGKEDTSQ